MHHLLSTWRISNVNSGASGAWHWSQELREWESYKYRESSTFKRLVLLFSLSNHLLSLSYIFSKTFTNLIRVGPGISPTRPGIGQPMGGNQRKRKMRGFKGNQCNSAPFFFCCVSSFSSSLFFIFQVLSLTFLNFEVLKWR